MSADEALAEAIVDLCWKATPTGTTRDGDTHTYILPKGAIHRLVGAAQCAGILASLRAGGVSADFFTCTRCKHSRHDHGPISLGACQVGPCTCVGFLNPTSAPASASTRLREALREAVETSSQRPASAKRRMPTLRPIPPSEGGAR